MTETPDKKRSDPNEGISRAKVVLWAWAGLQILVTLLVALFADRLIENDTAAKVVQFVLAFLGLVFGVGFIFIEFQLDAILQRELKTVSKTITDWQEHAEGEFQASVRASIKAEMVELRALLPVFDAYLSIGASDRYGHRDKIVGIARKQLEELARGRTELEGNEYYAWLRHRLVDRRPEKVDAISFRPLSVYVNDPREKNFIKQNLEATRAGTKITRIFIIGQEELLPAAARAVVREQLLDGCVGCYVAWRDEVGADVVADMKGGGLSIYDSDEIFYDRSYFEQNLGEDTSVILSVRPRAEVIAAKHERFGEYRRGFDVLFESLVDHSQKNCSPQDRYLAICESLAGWARAHSIENAESLQALDEEIRALREG